MMNRREFVGTSVAAMAAMMLPARLFPFQQRAVSGSMWTYLWDIVDEGYDAALGRLRANGMNAVSLASAYHAGRFLAPHNPKRKLVFLEDGTVYFKPTSRLYGRIKPRVNSLVTQGESLATVKRHADKLGLETNAWVVCCHNTPLGTEYPDIACVDAFGDSLPHNLCPSNNDVRAYLRGIVKDIASHGVGRIELEAMQFQGFSHGLHHEREGIPLSFAAKFLLGLCFCPSCKKRAASEQIDIASVHQFTRTTLENLFEHPEAVNDKYKSVDDLPAEVFTPFLDWRTRVVASLAAELAEAVRGTTSVLRPLVSFDAAARTMVGMNPGKVASITGGVLMPGYVKEGAALRDPLTHMQKLVGSNELIVGFQVGLPESGGRNEFLDRMKTARELGVSKFNFYNYGFIPYERFEWIKEGLAQT